MQVVEALRSARLLIPIVKVPEGVAIKEHSHGDGDHDHGHDGDHGHGHGGDVVTGERLGTPTIERPDGRRALLCFTGVDVLGHWQADARPLPVTAVIAARAAIDEGADVLLIDGTWALDGGLLWALAEDRTPVPPQDDPAVVRAVGQIATEFLGGAGLPHAVVLEPDGDGLLVLVAPECAGDEAAVTAFARALAAHHVVRTRIRGGLAIGVSRDTR